MNKRYKVCPLSTELRNNAVTATNVYILEMEANDD